MFYCSPRSQVLDLSAKKRLNAGKEIHKRTKGWKENSRKTPTIHVSYAQHVFRFGTYSRNKEIKSASSSQLQVSSLGKVELANPQITSHSPDRDHDKILHCDCAFDIPT